jgi:hypothetical protein
MAEDVVTLDTPQDTPAETPTPAPVPTVDEIIARLATPAPVPTENIPLSDAQRYLLKSIQAKLAKLGQQKAEIDVQLVRFEGILQIEMLKIASTNKIDINKSGFNDNLEIVPMQTQGAGQQRQ